VLPDELLDKPGTTPEQTGEPESVEAEDSERLEDADREAEAEASEEDQQDRTDWKGMALGLKGRLEERNRIEEEYRLRAAHTSSTADPQMAHAQEEVVRIQRAVMAVQAGADAGDPGSVAMMALLAEQYQSAQRTIQDRAELNNELTLLRIRDEDEREQVRAYFATHRHEVANVTAARKAMLGERYESEKKTLATKTKQADEVMANKRAGVVKTYSRDVPTSEAKSRRMTESDYDSDISRLRSEGDTAGVRKMMRELQSGAVKITPG
jgi:hypothetical protein